jgi:hypothetical protein
MPAPPPAATPPACVRADDARSAAAALASASAARGIALDLAELAEVADDGTDLARLDATARRALARALGFRAEAVRQTYDELADARTPALLRLREGKRARFVAAISVDFGGALICDPSAGEVRPWSRADLCAAWEGDVLLLTPIPEERRALAQDLAALRSSVHRVRTFLGWAPRHGRRVAMLATLGVVIALAVRAPADSAFEALRTWSLAAACAGSMWSWISSTRCSACRRARTLAGGLPLAQIGAAVYLGLLSAPMLGVPAIARVALIGAVVGTHATLLLTLVRAKVSCTACLFVAWAALLAGGATIAVGDDARVVAAGAVVGAIGAFVGMRIARALAARG